MVIAMASTSIRRTALQKPSNNRRKPGPKRTGGGALIESLGIYLPPREVTTEQVLQGLPHEAGFPARAHDRHPIAADGRRDRVRHRSGGSGDRRLLNAHRLTIPPTSICLLCSNISRYNAPSAQFTLEPTTAARLRARFGFTNALAFDMTNACAGTFTAVHLVDVLLRQGVTRRAMVVSGEYITHLTVAAQLRNRQLHGPAAGMPDTGRFRHGHDLGAAPNAGVGFQEIDLYTLGKYHDLCVAKASAHPDGGAIMFTDPVKSAAVTIKEAVRHCLEALGRNHWACGILKWLIMHQTSEVTLDGAMREINRAAGKQVARRGNTVFHLAQRGNTATNSHFLAVRENIDAGKIAAGDKVIFAVSGSGQVVGSALYVFDDLPSRGAATRRRGLSRHPPRTSDLKMFPCARRFGVTRVGLVPKGYTGPVASVDLLKSAGEACFGDSAIRREDVDLVIHTGTYRSEFLCEPALAAIAAGELGINHDDEKPTGKRTFAFDLTNGAAGTLTGCLLAGQLLAAGKYRRALILASEIENNANSWPEHLLGVKETASALLLEEGAAGFFAFGCRTFPEHIGAAEAFTVAPTSGPRSAIATMPTMNNCSKPASASPCRSS